jgi:hypothetical protein
MSTLKTNTLSNVAGTASTAIENAINGSAKAWVNFNGTGTVAIRASYNVSSITDNGAGNYTVNFTTAFSNTNYSPITTAVGEPGLSYASLSNATSPATTSCQVVVSRPTQPGILVDSDYVSVAIFR